MTVSTVAAVHAAPVYLDAEATIDKACELIGQAAGRGARLAVFPEVFVPGFPYWINTHPPDVQAPMLARYAAQSVEVPGPLVDRIQVAARRAGTAVVLGVSERDGATLYNTQVFVDEHGDLLGRHRKLKPTFAERYVWGQGDGSTMHVFDMGVGRVGGLVCWEHTMDLARHAMALKGEQIHAASWPGLETAVNMRGSFDIQVEALSRTQALCGQCFVVVSENPVTGDVLDTIEELGPQSSLEAGGGWSAIVHPMGRYLAGPHTGPEEQILVADLELDDIALLKTLVDSGGHYARPEVLRLVLDEHPYSALEREHPQPPPQPRSVPLEP